jgi:hypothetical protein
MRLSVTELLDRIDSRRQAYAIGFSETERGPVLELASTEVVDDRAVVRGAFGHAE